MGAGPQTPPSCPTEAARLGVPLFPALARPPPHSSLHPQNPTMPQGTMLTPSLGTPRDPHQDFQSTSLKPAAALMGGVSLSRSLQDSPDPGGTSKYQDKQNQDPPPKCHHRSFTSGTPPCGDSTKTGAQHHLPRALASLMAQELCKIKLFFNSGPDFDFAKSVPG